MNCDRNHQNMIGMCLNCKSNFCEQCLIKHTTHLNRIVLTSNLLYLFYQTNIECLDIQKEALQTFPYNSKIIEHLNQVITISKNYIHAALNNQKFTHSIETYQSIIEKHYIREFINNLKNESKINETYKNQVNLFLIQEISKDDQIYLMLKNSDICNKIIKKIDCSLLKLGLYKEAQWLFDYYLKRLLNKSIFFHNYQIELMKQSKIGNKENIEAYEQIQNGRNLYLVNEYEKCLSFMDSLLQTNPGQITRDQANIFKGLSLFQLGKFQKAFESFSNVQNSIFQLFISITVDRMNNFDSTIKIYSQLNGEMPPSHFQKPLCYALFKKGRLGELKQYCHNLLKINPKNYCALLYLGVLAIQETDTGHESKKIAENLIRLKPHKLEGFILKCACIIINMELHQADEDIENFIKKNERLPFVIFVCNIVLFLQGEFDKSYQIICKIPESFFENPLDKLHYQILFLMNKQDYREAFQQLMQKQENSELFYYIVIREYCKDYSSNQGMDLNEFNLNEEAFQYICQQKQNLTQIKFLNLLLGKILFELKRFDQALTYFNDYPHESSAQVYMYFYQGLTLLELNKLEDAANCFECALSTDSTLLPLNFYFYKIVIDIMLGHFEKAQKLHGLDEYKNFRKNKFLEGFIYWIQGNSDKAEQILQLKELTDEFPLINLVLGWIWEEKNVKTAATIFFDKVYQYKPELRTFKTKYSFLTNGPYTNFIERNKAQFDSYDDKKFFNIKFMALFIETYGYDKFQRDLYVNLAQNLIIQLINQVHRQYQKKSDKLIKNYPFV